MKEEKNSQKGDLFMFRKLFAFLPQRNLKEKKDARKGKKSLLRKLLVFLSRGIVIGFTVIVVLVGLVWFLFRPTGNMRLAVNSHLKSFENEVRGHFETASVRTKKFIEYQGLLELKVKKDPVENKLPSKNLENNLGFGEAVELKLNFDFKSDIIHFGAKFNPETILTKVYDLFGYKDYYLVVSNFENEKILAKEGSKDDLELPIEGSRMIVRIHPTDNLGIEIPDNGFGTVDEIRNQLALYILKIFSIELSGETDCKIAVCLEELSQSLPSLEKTKSGFDILLSGYKHIECRNLDEKACSEKARTEFEDALTLDPGNAHARFGLGLVRLRQARDSVDQASVYTVGRYLMEAVVHLQAAQSKNSYIRSFLESNDWMELLKRLPGYSDLEITPHFIASAYNYGLAWTAFGKGEYTQVPVLLSKVKGMPKKFEVYSLALEYEAKLALANSSEEVDRLLDEFTIRTQGNNDDWMWNSTYGLYNCRWNGNNEQRKKLAIEHLQRASELAPDPVEVLDALVIKAWCYAFIGEIDKAQEEVKPVLEKLEKLDKEINNNKMRYGGIFFDLGNVFAQLKNYEEAAIYFGKSLALEPRFINRLQKGPDLADFRNSDQYKRLRLEY